MTILAIALAVFVIVAMGALIGTASYTWREEAANDDFPWAVSIPPPQPPTHGLTRTPSFRDPGKVRLGGFATSFPEQRDH